MWKDPTDVTNRKPRRLRGTPARKFGIKVSIGVIFIGCLIGCYQFFGPMGKEITQDIKNKVYDFSEAEEKRRLRIRYPMIFSDSKTSQDRPMSKMTGN